jgi:hypothetical protein
MDRRRLFPNARFPRSARICDVASGDFDPCARFPSALGSAQTHCPLDHTDLAVRLGNRSPGVSDALQMVSAWTVARAEACGVSTNF